MTVNFFHLSNLELLSYKMSNCDGQDLLYLQRSCFHVLSLDRDTLGNDYMDMLDMIADMVDSRVGHLGQEEKQAGECIV